MAKTAPKTSRMSARNDDLSDREMLANIHEAGGVEGWASTTEVAIACGFTSNGHKNRTLATRVASRLAYMRDAGMLESRPPDMSVPYTEPGSRDTLWRLSEKGDLIRSGRLSRAVEATLGKMNAGTEVMLMDALGRRYVEGDPTVAFALRRQMQHHLAHRKLRVR